jgi:RecA/RadA recombinase
MATLSTDVTAALASLRTRWGEAAPRVGGEALGGPGAVIGALATVPLPTEPGESTVSAPTPSRPPDDDRVVRTGFAALDAILGPGGVPRSTALALRGDGSSGKTTLALRLAAEAQATGSIVAYLDLARTLDPVEAVARGVRLEWLVVLEPASLDEALAMAGALISGRSVDLLIVDLPAERARSARGGAPVGGRAGPGRGGRRPASVADRLGRLAALARRADVLLVVLEPPGLPGPVSSAIAESAGLRLELAQRAWIRLGRDVVGQRTEVVVARSRAGPPGRRAELRILYADGGGRDACLLRQPLLSDAPTILQPRIDDRAIAPPPLAASPPPARPGAGDARPGLRLLPDRPGRPRRAALDERERAGRQPGGPRARRPTRDAPGVGPSARS